MVWQVWKLVNKPQFEWFIMGMIVLNTILLMMGYYGQSPEYTRFLKLGNTVLTAIFTVECILKLVAFGFKVRQYLTFLGHHSDMGCPLEEFNASIALRRP